MTLNRDSFRHFGAALVLGATAVLAGCDVGDGTRPETMTLLSAGSLSTDEVTLFQCFEGAVAAVVSFSNGEVANFLAEGGERPVELESSDESVVRVSNGNVPIPLRDGLVYPRGTLIPVAPGTATVTGRFASLEDSIEVRVLGAEGVQIAPEVQTVGVGSTQTFRVQALLEGQAVGTEVDALWSLLDANGQPVDAEIGLIDSVAGQVRALEEGGPFTVRAQLTACPDASALPAGIDPTDLMATTTFKAAQALVLEREFARVDGEGQPLPPQPLVVGTTEAFNAFFTFEDAADGRQDVSTQVLFLVTEVNELGEDEFSFRGLFGGLQVPNFLQAASPTEPGEPLTVSATFGSGDDQLASNVLPLEIVTAVLQALNVTPKDTIVGPRAELDFVVNADYRLADDSVITQTVTRHVTLTSSAPEIAVTDATPRRPGRVRAVAEVPGCSLIGASGRVVGEDGEILVRDEARLFVIDDTVDCTPVDDNTTP